VFIDESEVALIVYRLTYWWPSDAARFKLDACG